MQSDSSIKKNGDPTTEKKVMRNIREIERIVNLFNSQKGSLVLATSLDRLLAETKKTIVRNRQIQESLVSMGLFRVLQKILSCKALDLPQKVLIGAANLIVGACYQNLYNSVWVIRSSTICHILELLSRRWEVLIPDGHRWLCGSPMGQNELLPVDIVIDCLIEVTATILSVVPDPFDGIMSPKQLFLKDCDIKSIHTRTLDIIGFVVASGVVDRLFVYCGGVRGPVEGQQNVATLVKEGIDFLTTLIYALQSSWDQRKPDSTQLLAALESSEIAGTVSMSYSLLLHQGAPARPRIVIPNENLMPPAPGLLSASLVKSTLSLINGFAKLDMIGLQRILGSDSVSLQFRHIASQLLWQVIPHTEHSVTWDSLMSELLIAIGNFVLENPTNQAKIQAGQTPTVLQQLCTLPEPYFVNAKYSRYLLPTLIAATFGCKENEEILSQACIPMELLHGFMKSEFAKLNPICKRLSPFPFLPSTPSSTHSKPQLESLPMVTLAKANLSLTEASKLSPNN